MLARFPQPSRPVDSQVLELPVYAELLAPRLAGGYASALLVGFVASTLTHPAALAIYDAAATAIGLMAPRAEEPAMWMLWAAVEACVVCIEAQWVALALSHHATSGGGRAAASPLGISLAANLVSMGGGALLLRLNAHAASGPPAEVVITRDVAL